jgi:hypothetical protein
MVIKIENFTGYEDNCEIIINDNNGNYQRTYFLENLEFDMYLNQQCNRAIRITNYNCTHYNDLEVGIPYTLKNLELELIQNEIKNIVDWEEWEESQEKDVDDFMNNDLN